MIVSLRTRCRLGLVGLAVLLGIAGLVVSGQTSMGPYFVVDSTLVGLAPTTGEHVYPNVNAAIAALTDWVPAQDVYGATLVIYPGTNAVIPGTVINIPGLRIVSRDGADKTVLTVGGGGAPGSALLTIAAPRVSIDGITIDGSAPASPGAHALAIQQPECVVRSCLIMNAPGDGINIGTGADRTLISNCHITNNTGNAIGVAGGISGLRVENTECSSNIGSGLALGAGALHASVSGSTFSGNSGSGVVVGAGSTDITLSQSAFAANPNGVTTAPGCARLTIDLCNFSAHTARGGASLLLTAVSASRITGNTFVKSTGPAINLVGPSVANTISSNVITAGGTPPVPTAAIALAGAVQACSISSNQITGYNWGIQLQFVGLLGPAGNQVDGNTITRTLADGIWLFQSGGDNTISGNKIANCAGNGIYVGSRSRPGLGLPGAVSARDRFSQNEIADCTLSGITVAAFAGDGITSLRLEENTISGCGERGIAVASEVADGVAGLTVAVNVVSGNNLAGIDVGGTLLIYGSALASALDGITGLRVEENYVSANKAAGLVVANSPAASIRGNWVRGNVGVGVSVTNNAAVGQVSLAFFRNRIHENLGGGLVIVTGRSPLVVVEENTIFGNQGFGIQVTGLPIGGVSPYPFGCSLGRNWWGAKSGPAGVNGGTGNAVLGLDADPNGPYIVAPILPAPMFAHTSADAVRILELSRVALLGTFAATKVEVNRLDTAGLRLTFSGVEARTPAQVTTAAYTPEATRLFLPFDKGTVLRAAAVLVSGLVGGKVEIAFAYDSAVLEGASADRLCLYAHTGGTWTIPSGSTDWALTGGQWEALSSCATPGSQLVIGELPVTDLLGSVDAIALVLQD